MFANPEHCYAYGGQDAVDCGDDELSLESSPQNLREVSDIIDNTEIDETKFGISNSFATLSASLGRSSRIRKENSIERRKVEVTAAIFPPILPKVRGYD